MPLPLKVWLRRYDIQDCGKEKEMTKGYLVKVGIS
jgi:hypothetical protein